MRNIFSHFKQNFIFFTEVLTKAFKAFHFCPTQNRKKNYRKKPLKKIVWLSVAFSFLSQCWEEFVLLCSFRINFLQRHSREEKTLEGDHVFSRCFFLDLNTFGASGRLICYNCTIYSFANEKWAFCWSNWKGRIPNEKIIVWKFSMCVCCW